MASYTAGTFLATPSTVKKKWWLIDAKDLTLGRLASRVAILLRGKHKAYYTPYINCGDNIVIINAEKIKTTGKKLEQEVFYWHTGYPGGIKERKWKDILGGRFPERLIIKAIERMMPKESPLARLQMKGLHVYAGEVHPHQGQQPEVLQICLPKLHEENKVLHNS